MVVDGRADDSYPRRRTVPTKKNVPIPASVLMWCSCEVVYTIPTVNARYATQGGRVLLLRLAGRAQEQVPSVVVAPHRGGYDYIF